MFDRNIKSDFTTSVKSSLLSYLESNNEIKELQMHIENLKKEIRKEVDTITSSSRKNDDEALENILSQKFPSGALTEWSQEDNDGYVYGWPEVIELKTLENDGQVYLIYHAVSIDKKEFATFMRAKAFYDHFNEASQAIVIVGFISPVVRDLAQQFGVEFISTKNTY